MQSKSINEGYSPFEHLRQLLNDVEPGGNPIRLDLGEPQQQVPAFVQTAMYGYSDLLAKYPENFGSESLLQAISDWIYRRYAVRLFNENLLALNGSREGLFTAMLALCKGGTGSRVLMPNPAYQTYRAAALVMNYEPVPITADPALGFMPNYFDLPSRILNSVEAVYICSPSNPQGGVASAEYLIELLNLAERYDFRIFADECYSELYADKPPVGFLKIVSITKNNPERVVVFNSLSKRSGLPGLRSGFAGGGVESIRRMRNLRAKGGSPVPGMLQEISALAWGDETHVEKIRQECRKKYDLVSSIFGDLPKFVCPRAGLFAWLNVGDGSRSALDLWRQAGIRVLPGEYLAHTVDGHNPGYEYIRISLGLNIDSLDEALQSIRSVLF
ncbi:LL-diaminopimelate aminotransferase [Serratia ficaria]|uniref:aminotransferase class I/II-fold pyridoxal phosphate-dependent enzyme n=1 Tax=Serratia ficaria TaxID=61651 RepID=UPI00218364AB|nr:aminotransferase class I/II-fold pyridoxal phosphate-dependent enzyme [Serratia ficaria]CAI2534945.1 LL-diaminopimelate aminotransferase [Serratia ficaria]